MNTISPVQSIQSTPHGQSTMVSKNPNESESHFSGFQNTTIGDNTSSVPSVSSSPSNSLFQFTSKHLESYNQSVEDASDQLSNPVTRSTLTMINPHQTATNATNATNISDISNTARNSNITNVSNVANGGNGGNGLQAMTVPVATSPLVNVTTSKSTPFYNAPSAPSAASVPSAPAKGLELVGASKRLGELTAELAIAKDDLRQTQEELDASVVKIEHHKHTIENMKLEHDQAQEDLKRKVEHEMHQAYEQKFQERLKLELQAQLEKGHADMHELQSKYDSAIKQLQDVSSQLSSTQTEYNNHVEMLSNITAERDCALKAHSEKEELVNSMENKHEEMRERLSKMDFLQNEWTIERESMKEQFTIQYQALLDQIEEHKSQIAALQTTVDEHTTINPPTEVADLIDMRDAITPKGNKATDYTSRNVGEQGFAIEDHAIECMRQEFASINLVFGNLNDVAADWQTHDHENASNGSNGSDHVNKKTIHVCPHANNARKLHPLRESTHQNIMMQAGGGMHKLDEVARRKRCMELDSHVSYAVSAIGAEDKTSQGPAANYMHSNMLDIADWIKRQQTERHDTRVVSIGY